MSLSSEGVAPITEVEFSRLSSFIYRQFGIHLPAGKQDLLVRRLYSLLCQQGFSSFGEYYQHLTKNRSDAMFSELVNRITTNYTFFYREPAHFDFFKSQALKEAIVWHHGDRDLRIWCAAASTGEEPYTLGMLVMDVLGLDYSLWNAGVLATDISEKALAKARRGVYDQDELKLLPPRYIKTYFRKVGQSDYEVSGHLKKEITFRRFNLIKPEFNFKKPFDIIFCRNVMIYFDDQTRLSVVRNLYESLRDGGYLFIGHSESLMRFGNLFDYVQPAVYRKVTK
jgi:chemotaxis protein methyltransferase CheR